MEKGQKDVTAGALPLEIERKFLIDMPSKAYLQEAGFAVSDICQTYLLKEGDGASRRIRRRTVSGKPTYTKTSKQALTALSVIEREEVITEEEYEALLAERDPALSDIQKKRYTLPYEGHLLEIDIYPFWSHVAILEIELKDEDEDFSIPEEIAVIREVSADKRMKNRALARRVPNEEELL